MANNLFPQGIGCRHFSWLKSVFPLWQFLQLWVKPTLLVFGFSGDALSLLFVVELQVCTLSTVSRQSSISLYVTSGFSATFFMSVNQTSENQESICDTKHQKKTMLSVSFQAAKNSQEYTNHILVSTWGRGYVPPSMKMLRSINPISVSMFFVAVFTFSMASWKKQGWLRDTGSPFWNVEAADICGENGSKQQKITFFRMKARIQFPILYVAFALNA